MKKTITIIAFAIIASIQIKAQNTTQKSITRSQAEAIADSLVANFKQLAEKTRAMSFILADTLKARAIDYIVTADKLGQQSAIIADSITTRATTLLMQTQKEITTLCDSIIAEADRKKKNK